MIFDIVKNVLYFLMGLALGFSCGTFSLYLIVRAVLVCKGVV